LVDKTPLKKHKAGKVILYKVLGDPKGFELLAAESFLHVEFEEWLKTGNTDYVKNLNDRMSQAVGHWTTTKVLLPTHLFGELAKTPNGSNFLLKKNVPSLYTKIMFQSPEASLEQRSAMWALGHMMAGPNVSKLIPNIPEVVKFIVSKAESSLTLSFRGTAYYVLGLLAMQPEVRKLVDQNGWEAAGPDRLISFPKNYRTTTMFSVTPDAQINDSSDTEANDRDSDISLAIVEYKKNNIFNLDSTQLEILFFVEKLVNLVKQDECNARLQKMYNRDPSAFTNPKTLLIIFKLLENFKFTIKERQFIHTLFDKVDRNELLQQLDILKGITV